MPRPRATSNEGGGLGPPPPKLSVHRYCYVHYAHGFSPLIWLKQ